MGLSKIETTKNNYGHLFAQDRALILDAMNEAVSRLHAYENEHPGEDEGENAVAARPRSALSKIIPRISRVGRELRDGH
jgi:hypothetical protein